ncbi:SET domain-containing protein-lysine N-methyltransferase [Flavihumibacter cheonanensis]|uniref:SET domain-containing protein n=1 Tax=Flavihumibacter cheonanensis TaxID=1442385 RepID=UPI001EF992E1|nr:SET domain-containing protein [Flavihumibacter cheonanensis]MCG7752509.1 SET domain-containing protein [Flavihumibacter cheonanensis]
MILPCLIIAPTPSMGRGVFTLEPLEADTLVEISPVIVLSETDRLLLDKTLLHYYIFEWGEDNKACCVALGYVSLYNHSFQSNCEYEMDMESQMIRIKTVRPINAGEELFINYNGDWNDPKPLWFDAL